ncbi:MAG: response regulator [Actinomycetota bacterium]|nr:response regulator [Actinomycetota bacterium]
MRRVLIIDDEVDVRLLYRVNLHHAGYEVLEADGGERGIAVALEETPDAVVLDLMMPRVDGFEVLRALRAEPATVEVPVLVLTADSLVDDHRICFELGADAVITKPFMPEVLTESIARLLAMSLEDRLQSRRDGAETARSAFG